MQNAQLIGNCIGKFMADFTHDGNMGYLNMMRIRVGITINQSFPTGFHNQRANGSKQWIQFKFEKLPGICFNYGIMGHLRRNCSKSTDEGDLADGKLEFGPCLELIHHKESPLKLPSIRPKSPPQTKPHLPCQTRLQSVIVLSSLVLSIL